MFGIYKTLLHSTGIDNAVYCNFINSQDMNLITASNNVLKVYKLNHDDGISGQTRKKFKQIGRAHV